MAATGLRRFISYISPNSCFASGHSCHSFPLSHFEVCVSLLLLPLLFVPPPSHLHPPPRLILSTLTTIISSHLHPLPPSLRSSASHISALPFAGRIFCFLSYLSP